MQQHRFRDKTWHIGTLSEIKGFDKKLISKDKGRSGLSWCSGGPIGPDGPGGPGGPRGQP